MDITVCDSAGKAIITNGVINDELLFPIELDKYNTWIFNYVQSANSNMELINRIAELVKRYVDGDASHKEFITKELEGMWVFFVSYANSPDENFINFLINGITTVNSRIKLNMLNNNVVVPQIFGFPKKDNEIANVKINVNNARISPKKQNKRTNSEDEEGFIKPTKTSKISQPTIAQPIPLKNNFDNLIEMNDVDNLENVNTVIKRKDPRPEPIHLKVVENWREISDKIDSLTKTKIIKTFQGDVIKFIPKTVDHYRIIQNYLSEQKLEFFGLKLKNERPRKVLFKGIPIDANINEIKDELTSLNFNIHRVAQLRNFKTKNPMPIFMVDIFPDDEFKNIFEVNSILGFLVKVEIYKFKGARQCYNCQRYNHSSEVCRLKPVCLKCSGEHRAKECPIKPDDRANIKCANCSGNHTANFGGCPKNPKNIPNSRTANIKNAPRTFNSNKTNDNVSFANLVKGSPLPPFTNANTKPKSNSKNVINSENSTNFNISNALPEHVPNSQTTNKNDFLNYIIKNNVNIDTFTEKLEKLFNIFSKLTKLLREEGLESIVQILEADSSKGIF